ncbi:MAG: rhamnulokinase [Prevotella sp.]|jgi:rhamnulokinase|nr:rhamnulokinase [Prevotella sp.]
MDFGASTGRGILGSFDGKKLVLKEIGRFTNFYVDLNGTYYWDVMYLLKKILEMLSTAHKQTSGQSLVSLGLDTWGTDYGLLDKNGQLLGNVRCMRNADGYGARAVVKKIGGERLFSRTGLQMLYGNTLFQLYERLVNGDGAFQSAECLLMLPDLLAYFLTGVKHSEYTIVSTSMMYNPAKRNWDFEIMEELGIPTRLFFPVQLPCQQQFPLQKVIYQETGFSCLDYVPVATHDTASAVAAVPLGKDDAFCSSGTWSILGVESEKPVLTDEAYHANFSNEGTIDGKYRLIKNIMGMWLIQQCSYDWKRSGNDLKWDEIIKRAADAPTFRSLIDVECTDFYKAGGMVGKIQQYCRDSGQAIPEDVGEIARCIYESITMCYRITIEQLEKLCGYKIRALHIVGGGSQNSMLNQMVADALNRTVYAGPVEAACIVSLLAQSISDNEITGLKQLREIVQLSFNIDIYEPKSTATWDNAYGRYIDFLQKRGKRSGAVHGSSLYP